LVFIRSSSTHLAARNATKLNSTRIQFMVIWGATFESV
jgi:hypothetical protein